MARVKGALSTRKRRNKTLKLAKGYFGAKSKLFKTAKEAVMKSGNYAYARGRGRGRGGRMSMNTYHKRHYNDYYDDEDENDYEYELHGTYNMRGGNYAMDDYGRYGYDNYARGRRMSR